MNRSTQETRLEKINRLHINIRSLLKDIAKVDKNFEDNYDTGYKAPQYTRDASNCGKKIEELLIEIKNFRYNNIQCIDNKTLLAIREELKNAYNNAYNISTPHEPKSMPILDKAIQSVTIMTNAKINAISQRFDLQRMKIGSDTTVLQQNLKNVVGSYLTVKDKSKYINSFTRPTPEKKESCSIF